MKKRYIIILCCSTILNSLFLLSCSEEDRELSLKADFTTSVQHIVAGETVYFNDNSEGYPESWSWSFEGASLLQSDLFSPEVIFYYPGTYTVKLVVGRGNESTSIERTIEVGYPDEIEAIFSVDTTTTTNTDTLYFVDESSGYPTSWLWEFTAQDGTTITSNKQHPEMILDKGIYSVTLTITNPNKSASKTFEDYITVNDAFFIEADFEAISRNTYGGGSIHFIDNTVGIVNNWKWTFEGGTPSSSSEQNPIVVFPAPGKYKVSLESSNQSNSSSIEKADYVLVIPERDLVFYLPFDGDGNDAGPNNLTPDVVRKGVSEIIFDAPSRYSGDDAEKRQTARFTSENADNYAILSVPETDLLDFSSSDFTTSFWVKLDPISRNNAIFHHGAGPGFRPDNQNRQTWFRFQPSGQYIRWAVEHSGRSGNWTEYRDKSMADGQWHHYVAIYKEVDGSMNTYIYVDGVLFATDFGKPLKNIDKTPYYIGANYRYRDGQFASENWLNGYIDDYIVYGRALSEEEAISLYNNLK